MDKQIKAPKGIKIIAGLMFVFGLINFGMHLTEGITWTTEPTGKTTFSISLRNFYLPGKFADTIVSEMLDETGKIISPSKPVGPESITGTIHWYAQNIASLFWAILFIIAGIGLWKIKNWGLLLALIALTARISLEVVLTPLYFIWVREAVGTPPLFYKNWIQVITYGGGRD
ncbi:MAG: hypothetical protein QME81_19875 [bacterium]|nr:hypothetical protein [bacterium]